MLFPLMFINPPLYWAMRWGANVRHSMVPMPLPVHYALMRGVYGF